MSILRTGEGLTNELIGRRIYGERISKRKKRSLLFRMGERSEGDLGSRIDINVSGGATSVANN